MDPAILAKYANRFWSYVDRSNPDGCWPWTGATTRGYGNFTVLIAPRRRKCLRSSRIAFFLTTGEDPGRDMIRHACDNPPCCRPDHLLRGTHTDNMRDARERNRDAAGERHGGARLRVDDVVEMRERYRAGATAQEVADLFHCNPNHALAVVRGEAWGRVPGACDEHRDRRAQGGRHWNATLTAEQVILIRRRSTERHAALAAEFGVDRPAISRLLRRASWKHLPPE